MGKNKSFYTWVEIENMSSEEVREANKHLAGVAFRRFFTMHLIKWGAIFLGSYLANMYLKRQMNSKKP